MNKSLISDLRRGRAGNFPDFIRLTLEDRKEYEGLLAGYPPIADIQFYSLMVRWNGRDTHSIAKLGKNLIISYWMAGSEHNSGLSLVGTERVDEAICQIFDHQREQSETPRLVHVPEFVIENIQHPELFEFSAERNFDEYIVPIEKMAVLQQIPLFRRHRLKMFQKRFEPSRVVIRRMDLGDERDRVELLKAAGEWADQGFINSLARHVNETIDLAINSAEALAISSLGLFLDGQLSGFILYNLPKDRRYMLLTHALVKNKIPYAYDYMVYAFTQRLMDDGILYANIDSDLGLPLLRGVKLALGPENYFRKYTITPAASR